MATPTDVPPTGNAVSEPSASETPAIPTATPTFPVPTTQAARCQEIYVENESDRIRYDLYAYLGITEHAGYFDEQIVFPNTTGETLSELLLVVEPSRTEGVFSISGINLAGQQVDDYSLYGGYLRVPLMVPLPDGCSAALRIEYHLDFPQQAGIFGYTENQLVLSNWYPFIPPYQSGQGWLVHDPARYGEHLIYPVADFDVTIELSNPPDDLVVAAPAPAVMEDGRYHYTLSGARAFALAFLTDYAVQMRQWNGVDITVYSKWATREAVGAVLDTAAQSLAYFESILGPYPFESLTIVQLEMYDGMESDAIFFLSGHVFGTYNSGPRNMLIYLIPHEISHNYWFSQVANDQALEPWLDEALSTYCEKLFYEQAFPQHVAWWWEYRLDQWGPEGDVDATIYTYPAYETYRQAVYLRGVEFFHGLRQLMGDEAFLAFLRSYLEHGRYRIMTAEDFFNLLEGEYGIQVDDLIARYFGGW